MEFDVLAAVIAEALFGLELLGDIGLAAAAEFLEGAVEQELELLLAGNADPEVIIGHGGHVENGTYGCCRA